MAAIIIRTHESKTPGEDFASEERKGRWRELPCPLTVKLFHAAGWLASPGYEWVCRAVDRRLALPTASIKKSLLSFHCETFIFLSIFGKTGNSVVFLLFFLNGEKELGDLFNRKKTSITLRDLERDLLNFNMTRFFPTLMGS